MPRWLSNDGRETLDMLVFELELSLDRGPGLGWTSPQHNNKVITKVVKSNMTNIQYKFLMK